MSTEILIVFICALAFGYRMYKVGIKEGAEKCIDHLHEQKIICYDNKGNIKPNQFFQEED